jgi:hypothetical protein
MQGHPTKGGLLFYNAVTINEWMNEGGATGIISKVNNLIVRKLKFLI